MKKLKIASIVFAMAMMAPVVMPMDVRAVDCAVYAGDLANLCAAVNYAEGTISEITNAGYAAYVSGTNNIAGSIEGVNGLLSQARELLGTATADCTWTDDGLVQALNESVKALEVLYRNAKYETNNVLSNSSWGLVGSRSEQPAGNGGSNNVSNNNSNSNNSASNNAGVNVTAPSTAAAAVQAVARNLGVATGAQVNSSDADGASDDIEENAEQPDAMDEEDADVVETSNLANEENAEEIEVPRSGGWFNLGNPSEWAMETWIYVVAIAGVVAMAITAGVLAVVKKVRSGRVYVED